MLDHVFTDAIGALRDAFENGPPRAPGLRGAVPGRRPARRPDLGDDLRACPGEGLPPRVQADITLDWPTWAQTAYRSWYIGEPLDEPPRIEIEIVLRIQRLRRAPDPADAARRAARAEPAHRRRAPRARRAPPSRRIYGDDLDDAEYAIEVSYEGTYELDEATLADGSMLDDHFCAMGGWIASTLVRLGDLTFDFLPPDATSRSLTDPRSRPMSDLVLVEVADRVATVTLNRPEARNALSPGAAARPSARRSRELEADDDVDVDRPHRRRPGLLRRRSTSRSWAPAAATSGRDPAAGDARPAPSAGPLPARHQAGHRRHQRRRHHRRVRAGAGLRLPRRLATGPASPTPTPGSASSPGGASPCCSPRPSASAGPGR